MASTRRLRMPGRERRTQAERTAATRAQIVAAVLDCVSEAGLARTTAAEITRRAGVTWGAVQHHFGDKDGILVAVVEDSFDRFASRLDGIPTRGESLAGRAALFVDRAWEHFSSPEYRSTFEILLEFQGRTDLRDSTRWQARMFHAWDRVWMEIFHDAPIARARHRILEHYTIAALSGLSSTLMLEGPRATLRGEELDLLKQTLARELAARGRV